MKNRLSTNALRNIRSCFPRFMSLFIISLLGVFVFAGLQATAPDMLNSLDSYLDDYDTYDIKIVSSMGLTDDDIAALAQLKDVEAVMASYSADVAVTLSEEQYVISVCSLPSNLNKLNVLTGRLPQAENEIAVEAKLLSDNGLQLNDTITLENENLKNKQFVIVGTVDSSLYFNNAQTYRDRGSTSIGTGTVSYFTYTAASAFDQDYYNAFT